MSHEAFRFSTPLPLQPDFVDTMPPTAPPAPRLATSHGQQPVATPPASPATVRPLISSQTRCMELGMCQARKPACEGCDHEEAFWRAAQRRAEVPIQVDGPFRPARYRRAKLLAGWLAWLTVMGLVGALFIIVFGWVK